VGGITPFLSIMQLADYKGRMLAPHFAMEIHLHLSAAYPRESWLEHFEWLAPLFNEQLSLKEGRMWLPSRPGLGFTLSSQAQAWTRERFECGKRP
jgi:L-talarate/galactarate dehydratase